jgi:hypothetical protein
MKKNRSENHLLVLTGAVLSAASLVGFVLCLVFQWPSQFVLGDAVHTRVTLADVVTGTVLSPPLVPWVVLVASTLLARSGRWWGTVATVLLSLLGVVFTIGGWGEAFGPANPYVPGSVLLGGGIAWMVLGVSLFAFGVRELIARRRGRGRGSDADAANIDTTLASPL